MSDTTKILVVSDVHGRLRDLRWVLQNESADALFFLGDGLYDLNAALELRKTPVPYPPRGWRLLAGCSSFTPTATITASSRAASGWPSAPGNGAPMWPFSATPM